MDVTTFLEVEVRVDHAHRQFRVEPIDKPSKLGVPLLSWKSAHTPSVHNSWPSCMMSNKLSLCSDSAIRCKVHRAFLERAHLSNLSPISLQAIASLRPNQRLGTQTSCVRSSNPADRGAALWLVLPFYPALHKAAVSRSVHNFLRSSTALNLLALVFGCQPPKVRCDWKNSVANVSRCLLSC